MTAFIFVNDINTQLAGSISSSDTTITLASSLNLPASIPAGYNLVITLRDAATRQNTEIVYATSITGTTLTVVRGQEGTTALAWLVGDYAFSGPTGGQMSTVQSGRLLNIRSFPGPGIGITVPNTYAYTPTTGTKAIRVRVLGGGGAGGGVPATSSTQLAVGGPGNAGAYAESYLTTGFATGITITAGVGGFANTGVAGGNGGASSFGSLVVANGGAGGVGGVASSAFPISSGPNTAATATGGNIVNANGAVGSVGFCVSGGGYGAIGANSVYGAGGTAVSVNGTGYGSGGSGFQNPSNGIARSGGYGASGIVIVEEYA